MLALSGLVLAADMPLLLDELYVFMMVAGIRPFLGVSILDLG